LGANANNANKNFSFGLVLQTTAWQFKLGAGVEQSFDCLIAQSCQAMQSMRMSMVWTSEDNIFNSLFFCETHTGCKGGCVQSVQAGAETSNTGVEAVEAYQAVLRKVIRRGCLCQG